MSWRVAVCVGCDVSGRCFVGSWCRGNSSVVERWIPVPAVGGSIPSSLILCSFTASLCAWTRREQLPSRSRINYVGYKYQLSSTVKRQKVRYFSIYACHPCAGAMLIFSVSFQFLRMTTEVVPISSANRSPTSTRPGLISRTTSATSEAYTFRHSSITIENVLFLSNTDPRSSCMEPSAEGWCMGRRNEKATAVRFEITRVAPLT